jgi:hypothetical protein
MSDLRTVRFDRFEERPVIGEHVFDTDGGDNFVESLEIIGNASATSLKNALVASGGATLLISPIAAEQFDAEWSPRESVEFYGNAVANRLELHVFFESSSRDEEGQTKTKIAQLVRPMLDRHRARLVGLQIDAGEGPWLWRMEIAPSTGAKSVAELLTMGLQVEALLGRVHGDGLDQASVREILRAGMPDLLIGWPEGAWLDAKSQDYDLQTDRGKISIAQDVARFANAETGGMIAVGLTTKKRASGETIQRVAPLPGNPHGTMRHMKAIDHRVFPPPDGLTVEQIAISGGFIMLIDIPPQPEEHKPFLVQGAVTSDGNVEGGFISIVRRRGEDSIPISAVAIHATLAAGRALLRRGEVPLPTPRGETDGT